jgi:hypothetical protein
MHHPEVNQTNPTGYSVHWDRVTPTYRAAFPWLKVALVCVGSSLIALAAGYLWASQATANQVAEAQQMKAEAEQMKASVGSDLAAAQAKLAEQNARLRKVNDCVYDALNSPIASPSPTK